MSSGGVREGAGRKTVRADEKRVQMVVTINPDTRDRLRAEAKAMKTTPGRVLDRLFSIKK